MPAKDKDLTTTRQLMEKLVEHLDTLPEEKRKEWGKDLVRWADEQDEKRFAKAKAMGAKVWDVFGVDPETQKRRDLGPFIARDREAAIQQAQRLPGYRHLKLDATEAHRDQQPASAAEQASPKGEQDKEQAQQPVQRLRIPFIVYLGAAVVVLIAAVEVTQHFGRAVQAIFWLLVFGGMLAHWKLTAK